MYREGKEDSEPEVPADLSQRVVFKKRVPKDKPAKETIDKEFDDHKIKDSNDEKKEKNKSKSKNKSNQLTLSHLGDDEEDE